MFYFLRRGRVGVLIRSKGANLCVTIAARLTAPREGRDDRLRLYARVEKDDRRSALRAARSMQRYGPAGIPIAKLHSLITVGKYA